MKKLIIFVLFLLIANPAFAGNLLQQEYETTKAVEISKDTSLYNKSAKGLIQDDYLHYLNGGGSLYGVLIYKKEQLEKNVKSTNSLDLRYVNLMIKKYDLVIKGINNHLVKPDKIVVDDVEYKQLSEDVKNVMAGLNLIFSN